MKNPVTKTALISMLLLMSGIATADSKTVPGSICSPNDNEFGYFIRDQGGIATDPGSFDPVDLTCPIVREKTNNAPIVALELRFRQTNFVNVPTSRPFCFAISTDQWGNTVSNQQKKVPKRSSRIDNIRLRFTNIPTSFKGTVVVRCRVPSGYQLSTIYWDE